MPTMHIRRHWAHQHQHRCHRRCHLRRRHRTVLMLQIVIILQLWNQILEHVRNSAFVIAIMNIVGLVLQCKKPSFMRETEKENEKCYDFFLPFKSLYLQNCMMAVPIRAWFQMKSTNFRFLLNILQNTFYLHLCRTYNTSTITNKNYLVT